MDTPAQDLAMPPPEATQLWVEVDSGLVEHQTVVWNKAVDSLENARKYLVTSKTARDFVDKCMLQIVTLLLEQQPIKIGQWEKGCVEDVLSCSLQIVNEYFKASLISDGHANLNMGTAIDTLFKIVKGKNVYYSTNTINTSALAPGQGNVRQQVGLPKLRQRMVAEFCLAYGFTYLAAYVKRVCSTDSILQTNSTQMHSILGAAYESMPESNYQDQEAEELTELTLVAKSIADAYMQHLTGLDEDVLREMDAQVIKQICQKLRKIYCRILEYYPQILTDTYCLCWRTFVLKLISSKHPSLSTVGWDQMRMLVDHSKKLNPPPRSYTVSGAGLPFINGMYEIVPDRLLPSGYLKPDTELSYQRTVPTDYQDDGVAGRVITLSLCTMRSQHKWWFLSHADEDQPGTDRDIDYYQHKSRRAEAYKPSSTGWLTCHAGEDPPPSLEPVGLIAPADTASDYEQQLVKWATEHGVLQLAFGHSPHRDVVQLAAPLIEFLASKCKDDHSLETPGDPGNPNQICLDTFLRAWEICTNTCQMEVLAGLYHVLASLVRSLPVQFHDLVKSTIKTAMIRRIEHDDPALPELEINGNLRGDGQTREFAPDNDSDLAKLGFCIAKNSHLNSLSFYSTFDWEGFGAVSAQAFFGVLKKHDSIRTLSITGQDFSSRHNTGILSAFGNRRGHLLQIDLHRCNMDKDGMRALTSTITKCQTLEKICLTNNRINANLLLDLVPAIRAHEQVKTLNLKGNTIDDVGCDMLAELLADPQCSLTTLDLCQNQIDVVGYYTLANALSENNKLESLSLAGNNAGNNNASTIYDAFTEKLCNASSINAIYLSNHTLKSIDLIERSTVSNEAAIYLSINQDTNKSHIAMKKILRYYPHHFDMEPFFEWDLKILPAVFSWFDTARSCEDIDEEMTNTRLLSNIYQYTRAMPMMFVPSSKETKKRKLQESN